ncbi:MAG: fibronectin type III domain-containing protein [Myxococcota bacterium]
MDQLLNLWRFAALVVLLLSTSSARAEGPRFFNLEGFGEFLDGNPESTAITEDGVITLPPVTRERFTDAAATFSAATARGEVVIVARIDDGQVVAIDRAGKTKTLFEAEETLVTALLAVGRDLYVATAEPAMIHRVDSSGTSSSFHVPDAAYIWGMVEGPNGSIFAVTGEPGTVIRIDKKGNGAVIFAPEQEHLRSITYDKSLGIFVGGGERGVLYRSANGKTFLALHDTSHTEITDIVVVGNYVYVAGVTGAEALVSEQSNEKVPGKGKSSVEVRSQLVRVGMDGSAEVIAGSNDEAIFGLGVDDKQRVLVATGASGRDDPRGRIYAVEPAKRLISMIYQAASRRLTHLIQLPRGALAAIGADGGRIIHLAGGYARQGEFLSLPFDTGINSHFGVAQVFGFWPKGTKVTVAARSGQTAEPDDSWSPWSKEISATTVARPSIPNGRHVQLRLTLSSQGNNTPEVHRVRLAYLRQNLPPFVREVVALKKGLALLPMQRDAPKSKTISLSDKAPEDSQVSEKSKKKPKKRRARQVERRGALTVKWVAEDPNGDDLRFNLSYRSLGQREWQTMKEKLKDPFYTINSAQLPDGHYQFRVHVTDSPSNPDGFELSDSRDSRSILVDNTAPSIDPLDITVRGRRVVVRTVVADAVGPIIRAEYSFDGKSFRPMVPDDGILDDAGETFTVRLSDVEPGPHSVTVRVADEAENEGYSEAQFSVR